MSVADLSDLLTIGGETVAHPSASPEERALLAWASEHPTGRPEAERTHNGRYKLPDPATKAAATWTRATNFAGTLSDDGGLTVWRNRLLVRGLTMAPDVWPVAKTAAEANDGRTLSSIADAALQRAGEKLGADIGTALHTAVEHLLLGTGERPPQPWRRDVEAFAACLDRHGLEVAPEHVERIALTACYGVAGTLDNLAGRKGKLYVGDLKTGKSFDRLAYAVQLALYANAEHLWKLDGSGYEPMPEGVDRSKAYVFHLPAGSGRCELVAVNIAEGWRLAELCDTVRTSRKAKCFTVEEPEPVEVEPLPCELRTPWIRERLLGLMASGDAAAVDYVRAYWPEGVPVSPPWNDAAIAKLDAVLRIAEASEAVPFPPADPCAPDPAEKIAEARAALAAARERDPSLRDTGEGGGYVTDEEAAALKAMVALLSEAQKGRVARWQGEGAKHEGRAWRYTRNSSKRIGAITEAAVYCVANLTDEGDDDDTAVRAALALVLGLDGLRPSWSTGLLFGALRSTEAKELTGLASRFAAGDPEATETIAAGVAALYRKALEP